MKTYKTSEAIAMLENNPNNILFEFKDMNKRCNLYVDDEGFLQFCIYHDEILIPATMPGGAFKNNLNIDRNWQLIQQPVDFLTAVKAYAEGKTIRCEIYGGVYKLPNPAGASCASLIDANSIPITAEHALKGQWYIEEE